MTEDIVRVFRVVEYVGPRSWVEQTVLNSIQGELRISENKVIKAATLGTYPEIFPSTQGEES